MKTIGNATTTKKAHEIRRELATKFDVPVKYINFGDCIKAAQGRLTIGKIRNKFNRTMGTNGDKITKILLCDPETPAVWTFNEVLKRAVNELGVSEVRAAKTLREFFREGFLIDNMGFWSVSSQARPFPQPMPQF